MNTRPGKSLQDRSSQAESHIFSKVTPRPLCNRRGRLWGVVEPLKFDIKQAEYAMPSEHQRKKVLSCLAVGASTPLGDGDEGGGRDPGHSWRGR